MNACNKKKSLYTTIFNRAIIKRRARAFLRIIPIIRVILNFLVSLEKGYSLCIFPRVSLENSSIRNFWFPSRGTIDSFIGPSVSVAWNFIITLYRIAERYCVGARGEEESLGSGGLAE